MRSFLEIARTGCDAVLLHPLRSAVTIVAMLALLVPWVTGLSILAGIDRDAAISVREGGDLYITGEQFGRSVPLSLAMLPDLETLDGVESVVPRIVGRTTLGRERTEVVVVGLPLEEFPNSLSIVDGRLPQANELNEFVIGTHVAERLNLEADSLLPPFYRNSEGERVSRIVGVFDSDAPIWQSRIMLSSFNTAERVFGQKGLATDIVIRCRSGYASDVADAVRRLAFHAGAEPEDRVSLRVVTRASLDARLAAGQMQRHGVFNLQFVLMFVVGILVVLVTSGIGLSERRREVGILKATGWQTDQILLRSFVEGSLLSLLSASLGIVAAFFWLRLLNGYGIASVILSGVDAVPSFRVPFQMMPVPALLAIVVAFTVIMSGSLWSSWRSAMASPAEAMR